MQVWAARWGGGAAKAIADGDAPAIAPGGERLAFVRGGAIFAAPLDGSKEASALVALKGKSGELQWSPDGTRLAFVSDRGGYSLLAVYSPAGEPIRYVAPAAYRVSSPRWSPDGTRIAFVRKAGKGGVPQTELDWHPDPWEICVVDVVSGSAANIQAASGSVRVVWKSPKTQPGSLPFTEGGANLN